MMGSEPGIAVSESWFGEHVDRIADKKDANQNSECVSVCERQEVEGNRYPGGTPDKQRRALAPLHELTNDCQRADLGGDAAAHHQRNGQQRLKEMEQNNA